MRGRILASRFFPIVLALSTIVGVPGVVRAGGMGILVPAYFYPGTGGTDGYTDGWAEMTAAASQVSITAIFNPDSGPGPSTDANYVNALSTLEAAGGKVVAYVYTDYGNTPLSTVEGQIATYLSQYGSLINGFFLDGMSNSASTVSYYQSLYAYIKGLGSSYEVIGNPGTSTIPAYLTPATQGADVLVTYENDAQYYAGTSPPSWVAGYPASAFDNTLYDQPTVAGMQGDIALAVQRNVGEIYVTDETINPPTGYLYDRMPSYWDQEVMAVASVPEPGPLVLLASGAAISISWARSGRRKPGAGCQIGA